MTSTALMNAILSMDAYNRGYDAGIVFGNNPESNNYSQDTNGTQIGDLTIRKNSSVIFNDTDQNIGFYALAYEDTSGNTIISYRGTDTFVKDPIHGWSLGGGDEDSPQARMAIQFFNEVVGTGNDPQTANILTTGHSMGGGHAALTASIYGKNATIFDSMHFVEGAEDTLQYRVELKDSFQNTQTVYVGAADWDTYTPPTGWTILSHDAPSTPDIYADTYLTNPDFSGVSSHRIDGEVLDGMLGYDGTSTTYALNDGGALGTIDKHSMATLVIRMFADEVGELKGNEWTIAEQYFWPTLYNDVFASSLGLNTHSKVAGQLQVDHKYSDILRNILAYSALNTGERPFGDTGIRAFYDDSIDLGRALSVAGGNQTFLTAIATDITELYTHFAGQLALNDVEKANTVTALNGIIDFKENPGDELTLNLSGDYWTAQIGNANHGHVITKSSLLTSLVQEASDYGVQILPIDVTTAIDDVTIRLSGGVTKTLSEGEMFIGAEGDDTITGSDTNDIVFGRGGSDVFRASAGYDVFDGGAGSDTLDFTNVSDDVQVIQKGATKLEITGGVEGEAYSIENINLGSGDDAVLNRM